MKKAVKKAVNSFFIIYIYISSSVYPPVNVIYDSCRISKCNEYFLRA